VVVAVGDTVLVAPEPSPLLQLYPVPPLAVSVCEAPLQILGDDGDTAAFGNALTVTCLLAVAEHPFCVTVTV
jgi:hypothetical protein